MRLGWGEETGRAPDVAMRHADSEGDVQGPMPWVKGPGSDEDLPVVNEPFIADALGLEGRGKEFAQMGVSRMTQHVTLLSTAVGGERGPSQKRGDRVRLVLQFVPGRVRRQVHPNMEVGHRGSTTLLPASLLVAVEVPRSPMMTAVPGWPARIDCRPGRKHAVDLHKTLASNLGVQTRGRATIGKPPPPGTLRTSRSGAVRVDTHARRRTMVLPAEHLCARS